MPENEVRDYRVRLTKGDCFLCFLLWLVTLLAAGGVGHDWAKAVYEAGVHEEYGVVFDGKDRKPLVVVPEFSVARGTATKLSDDTYRLHLTQEAQHCFTLIIDVTASTPLHGLRSGQATDVTASVERAEMNTKLSRGPKNSPDHLAPGRVVPPTTQQASPARGELPPLPNPGAAP